MPQWTQEDFDRLIEQDRAREDAQRLALAGRVESLETDLRARDARIAALEKSLRDILFHHGRGINPNLRRPAEALVYKFDGMD